MPGQNYAAMVFVVAGDTNNPSFLSAIASAVYHEITVVNSLVTTPRPDARIARNTLKSCEELEWRTNPDTPTVCAASVFGGACYHLEMWSYYDAMAVCDFAGGRICTLQEIASDATAGSGCYIDTELTWTTESCGNNSFYTLQGKGIFTTDTGPVCMPASQKGASVRCCAEYAFSPDGDISSTEETLPLTVAQPTIVTEETPAAPVAQPTEGSITSSMTAGTKATGISVKSCTELGWVSKPTTPSICAESEVTDGVMCFNSEGFDYPFADGLCQSVGARLCTLEEVAKDVTAGTGCGIDAQRIWTSTFCNDSDTGVVGRYTLYGKSTFNNIDSIRCSDATIGNGVASIRCCGDAPLFSTTDSSQTITQSTSANSTFNLESSTPAHAGQELTDCSVDAAILQFSQVVPGVKLLWTSRIGARISEVTVDQCAEECVIRGQSCVAIQTRASGLMCELMVHTSSDPSIISAPAWEMYDRTNPCITTPPRYNHKHDY